MGRRAHTEDDEIDRLLEPSPPVKDEPRREEQRPVPSAPAAVMSPEDEDPRAWLRAVEERRLSRAFLVEPPAPLITLSSAGSESTQLLQQVALWLQQTVDAGGSIFDLQRAWSALKPFDFSWKRTGELYNRYEHLCAEARRRGAAAGARGQHLNVIEAGKAAAAIQLDRARREVAEAEAVLVDKRTALARLEAA